MKYINSLAYGTIIALTVVFASCRKDPQPIPEEITNTLFPAEPNAAVKGMYVVNEGNMNMNKASLDYVDFTQGLYRKNIYNQVNPEVTKGLGDVANDIGVYGAKLYVVVNISNKIEVMDVKTAKRIKMIDLVNCRYITFHGNKAYVSAYLGKVGDPKAPQGIVAEIDTATLQITRKIKVGRQPEEMAVVGNKLYVANSGGYSPPNYERTVSVIDMDSFTEIKRIDVAINLHRLKADQYGDLYVTSRGDYYDIPSKLFVIDTKTDLVKKTFNVAASNLAIDGDKAYVYSTEYSYITGENTISYSMINVKDEAIIPGSFISDGTDKKIKIPYGIAVHPMTKDVFVSDATDYVTPGRLYCFGPDGRQKWSVETGDIPASFAFVYKTN